MMLNSVDSDVFLKSKSVTMKPVVSAEWNQNLFNPPYFTVAGDGVKQAIAYTSGATVTDATGSNIKANFTTKQFSLSSGKAEVKYTATGLSGGAFKIITYVKSSTRLPVMININAKGSSSQFGASSENVSLFGWTKIETYIGSANSLDTMSSFEYTISATAFDSDDASGIVYFTLPEVYKTTHFDYQNNSLWPTDKPFTYFRPGESYVSTGNALYSFPTNYRKINRVSASYPESSYFMPVSSIFQNPYYVDVTSPFPNIKNVAPSDLDRYKYFVSDTTTKTITAVYETNILTNKLVLKFNSIATVPTVNIAINGSNITVDGSQSISPDSNGILTLYWNGTAWTKTKWQNASMPTFANNGSIALSTQINKISVTQIGILDKRLPFKNYTNTTANNDLSRMQLVEVSPRLEIDLSNYVLSMSVSKSLDSKNNAVPISSINSNDANVTLSGIPLLNNNQPVPIFSSQSNSASTVLAKMLRKNIKFYVNFYLDEYSHPTTNAYTNADVLIPGGVFYSDSWVESDVDTVNIQMFDVSRYLQSTPAPDYVSNLRSAFEVITSVLEFIGFSDYDYDSLYDVCTDKLMPIDLTYFYCNSTDATIIDVLSEVFLSYQIAAYIDEYGVMRFTSLSKILEPKAISPIVINDEVLDDGGFSVDNKQKIGTISIRFQAPKIRQSLGVQNITDPTILESASFVYTTANTVVWSQESSDSVGYNFLDETMLESDNKFSMDVTDLLDPFHTFSLNSSGYAAIEDEIVSFDYKEYTISQNNPPITETVSVKNDLELASAINSFVRANQTALVSIPPATITNAIGNGSTITFTANNSFQAGQKVRISGAKPSTFNVFGNIISANSTSFVLQGNTLDAYDSGGFATVSAGYDLTIGPTGNITNVKRGMFGSRVSEHSVINDEPISAKNLSEAVIDNSTYAISPSSKCSITNYQISALASPGTKTLVYPTIERDTVPIIKNDGTPGTDTYNTYSMRGMFGGSDGSTNAIGLFFGLNSTLQSTANTIFVELIRYKDEDNNIKYALAIYYYDGLEEKILAWSDVTGFINSIIMNFEKTFVKLGTNEQPIYEPEQDEVFHIKVAHWLEPVMPEGEKSGEEENKELVSVFINNVEILNWQVLRETPDPVDGAWKEIERNPITKLPKKVVLSPAIATGTIFGAYTTTDPVDISGVTYPTVSTGVVGYIKEIYATYKPLRSRSVNYYFQDSEFLNGIVQGRNVCAQSKSYSMQVKPQISGINYYDVQYTTPAATTVDVLPIQYLWFYFPGAGVTEQQYYQKKLVDEYALAYSSILNTGFRARMAIANNSNHMVFLKHDSDQLNQFTNALTLWTHEVIAPSDPEIIERVIDASNASEVAQLDSNWIQSKDSAEKLAYLVSQALDGFSTDIRIQIFGNPLIQVGDEVLFSYSLAGISNRKYVVHSVDLSFDGGLTTSLTLNEITI